MTAAQQRRYFRFWRDAWAAHWSGVRGGEPIARPDRPESPVRDEVVAMAGRLAGNGPLTPDLLRHACHVLALGRDVRSVKMTNKEQDLVVSLFERLAEAGRELAGQLRLDDRARELDRRTSVRNGRTEADGGSAPWQVRRPDADRKRVLWSLEHSGYAEPAIAAISRDKFGTAAWRGLEDRALYQLLITVKRAAARQRVRQSAAVPLPPSREYVLRAAA